MKCPNCGSYLPFEKKRCDGCGQDLRIYKKAFGASNQYYNDGLAKAKVRDLSGAAASLKKSLQLDKKNKNARNLLGLVYYEMGEVVAALSEWVISKHFDGEDNEADRYIAALQSNPTKLEGINQTIRKYNSALLSARQGSDDLAVIQLKKVTASNPKFLRAQHLLALIYMKNHEYGQAQKCLLKAKKVDQNNTRTLYYQEELSKMQGDPHGAVSERPLTGEPQERKKREREEFRSFEPVTSYKEDKPNIFVFINLVLGLVIGILVCFFLIKPTIEKKAATNYNQDVNDNSEELSNKQVQIETLEGEKEQLTEENKTLTEQVEKLQGVVHDETIYDDLFDAISLYTEGKNREAATKLLEVDEKALEREAAKNMYDTIKTTTFETVSEEVYLEGNELYNTGTDYPGAVKLFKESLQFNPDNVDSIYFLGRAYDNMGKPEKAKQYYKKVIEDYPDSTRVSEAQSRLAALGVTLE